ncbi:MAG: acyl-CoA reductase [Thermoflexibacter sp.]|jgi:hypothetical protein|nr:acyl-CoA reductase [Thermoflexibacter sp.]
MSKKEIIQVFLTLKIRIQELTDEQLEQLCLQCQNENSWFTPTNVRLALQGLIHYLSEDNFQKWAESYTETTKIRKIGVVMAGNIPLVGIHDLICVLVSGHILYAKLSSQDSVLMKFIIQLLLEIAPALQERIYTVEQLKNIDAIIATGSDNTARYFEYYFKKYPHIIRKNRTSVAVLHGEETSNQLHQLGTDIFTYFGLGCRNVTKIYVPESYNFNYFFENIEHFQKVFEHHKYVNNYDYNKSIYLIDRITHLDNGFLILAENPSLFSPISVLHYEKYADIAHLNEQLAERAESIQCMVGDRERFPSMIEFGKAQSPHIQDYADGVDTMLFLTNL